MDARIIELDTLSPAQQDDVRRLAGVAPGAADNPPISERGMLQLPAGAPVRHLLGWSGPELVGYAQLDAAESTPTVELLASEPAVGSALLDAARAAAGDRGLLLWAHGPSSAANQAALRAGLPPVRTLLQLRRSLADLRLPEPSIPAGIRIRPFVPGQDDQAWLAVNARAFAHHPEQGSWGPPELAERLAASWFDPAGFLLAERVTPGGTAELIGYHWTKVHAEAAPPIGEVYVLGVDPAAQGLRLGTLLLNEGLRHLQGLGLTSVLLYVEQSSGTAVHLYGRAGFTVFSSDIQYAAH